MIKKILKLIGIIISIAIFLVAVIFVYFNFPVWSYDKNADLGVTFSNLYSKDIGLDWKENYIAMLDDLKIRKIRIPVYWDQVEIQDDKYDFSDVDWQLAEAKKRNAEIILAFGQKVPRWPECFIPEWIGNNDQKRKEKLVDFVKVVAERYKNNSEVKYWQIENEPFLTFGICPAIDPDLIDDEISVVKSIDNSRKIIVTDSGELSVWLQAAKRADIFGTTMYLKIWSKKVGYFDYPIGPRFFHFKKWLIKNFANQENSIVVELQGEPWLSGWTIDRPVEEQLAHMNPEMLKNNVEFAKKADFSEIYLWGVEWWYWLKIKQNHSEVWDEAKILFQNQ